MRTLSRVVFVLITTLALSLFTASRGHTQSAPEPPGVVRAILYSTSAAELFWIPNADNDRVEVTRNDESLGRTNSRSLFEDDLVSDRLYRYELRSVSVNGDRSPSVVLSFTPQDFDHSFEDITPDDDNTTSATVASEDNTDDGGAQFTSSSTGSLVAPQQVRVALYSRSAAELFWLRNDNQVKITRNGESLGLFQSTSLFEPDLERSETYHYELRAVNDDGEFSSAVVLTFSPGSFDDGVRDIAPIEDSGEDNAVSAPGVQAGQPTLVAPVMNDAVVDDVTLDVAPEPVVVPQFLQQPVIAEPETTQNFVADGSTCVASDINSLRSCVNNASAHQRIALDRDIACGANCCPNGGALLRFNGVQGLEILGNGHEVFRSQGQRQCSLLDINNSRNIAITGLHLDDDIRVMGCQVADNCPRMVYVRSSSNISFEDTHVAHGKGYAFYVQGTNGFRFHRGSLHNSGVLGMYIGHERDASSNVTISDSLFTDNQTNGLALLGVTGQRVDSNVVQNNRFLRNHRRGQWQVEPRFGTGFTGGGQLYVARANNVTVRNNVVQDGYCDNCFIQSRNRSGVSGIELGRPNQQSLSNVVISDNRLLNLDGFGISQNQNSSLTRNVSVRNNVILNSSLGEIVQGANESGNRILDTQQFDSFEASSDVGGRFSTSTSCSAGASVSRVCGVPSRFGQCAVELKMGDAQCSGAQAVLEGPRFTIRAGQTVALTGWVRSPVGNWCAEFRNGSREVISRQCSNLSSSGSSNVQPFVGTPTIQAVAPGGSATVNVRVVNDRASSTMWLDDIKLAIGNL